MSLLKVSLLNAVAVAVRIASSLVTNKILAIYIGPGGYAVVGQFQNFVSLLISLAGGLIATGVTKATAEHSSNQERQNKIWQTATRLSLAASLVLGLIVLLGGEKMSEWLLQRSDMSNVFVWLAITLPAMALNNVLLAIVVGKKDIRTSVAANILGSLLGVGITGLLAYFSGLYGALLAMVVNPAVILFSTAALLARRNWFNVQNLWGNIDFNATKELSGFALMGITTALVVPISYMLIREHLSSHLGLEVAGYWQASWKISEIYLMLITSTLAVYYLPRLAEIKTALELKSEIFKIYRFVMPVVIIGAVTIYALRDYIIDVLFTEEFSPMRELFAWQMFGDVIKIGSWVLGYILVGRSMVKYFVISEIIFSCCFVWLSWLLSDRYGAVGVPISYAVNYFIYWIVMAFLAKREFGVMEKVHAD